MRATLREDSGALHFGGVRLVAVPLSCLVLASCVLRSDNDVADAGLTSEGEGEGEVEEPPRALPTELATPLREYFDRCEPTFIAKVRLGGASEWVVRNLTDPPPSVGLADAVFDRLETVFNLAGIEIEPGGMIRCLEAVGIAACADTEEVTRICEQMFVGFLEADVPCGLSTQCRSRFCSMANPPECGTCTGSSVPCTSDLECGEGFRCNKSTVGSINGPSCTPAIAAGDDCSPASDVCELGLLCLDGICSPPRTIGEPCSVLGDCRASLSCMAEGCVQYSPGTEPGDPCPCQGDLTCVLPGLCVHLGAVGNVCDEVDRRCDDDLYCQDGVCDFDYVEAVGDECDLLDSICPLGSTCHLGRCASIVAIGSPCSLQDFCEGGAICLGGFCRQPIEGEPCGLERSCAPQHYCDNLLDTCVAAAEGDPCDAQFQCADIGVCSESVCVQSDEGEPCFGQSIYCRPDLVCGVGNVCASPGIVGDVCNDIDHCEAGLSCRQGLCGPPLEVGELCGLFDTCVDDAECAVGVCVAPSAPGEVCGAAGCAENLICSNERCKFPAEKNEACLSDNIACQHGTECVDGVCSVVVRGVYEGDACAADDPDSCGGVTRAGLVCNAGLCRRPEIVDEDCDALRICRNAATTAFCDSGDCRARPRAGEPCSDGDVPCSQLEATCSAGVCIPLPNDGRERFFPEFESCDDDRSP